MPAPLIAAGIAAAGGAISSMEKNQQERQIQDAWQQYMDDVSNVQDFSPRQISGREFEVNPQTYQMPDDIKFDLIKMDPAERAKVMSSIDQMKGLSNNKIQSQTDLDRAKTMMDSSQESSAREQGVLSDLAGRGMPGMEALVRSQGAQDTAQRLMMGGLQANANAGQERLGAGQMYQNMLKNMYDTDYQQQAQNTDISNRANQMNAERKRQINERNVDMLNNAKYYNTGMNQNIFNTNTNNARTAYIDKLNHLGMQQYPLTQKSGSMRQQGENTASAINSGTNAVGGAMSSMYGMPASGGAAQSAMPSQSTPDYYWGNYKDYMNQAVK